MNIKTALFSFSSSVSARISSSKKEVIRDKIVKFVSPIMDEYTDWSVESGMYLPPGYETRPSDWAEVLRKIQRAFLLLEDEINKEGELWEAKNKWEWKGYIEEDTEKIEELNQEIRTGLELFGKHLFDLVDQDYRKN